MTTKQGTQYAITISDSNKFLDLFFSLTFDNGLTDAINVRQRFWASEDLFDPLYKKYFDPKNTKRKIKGTNLNDLD
ncbi:MAG: hypothetical protein L0J63_11785, partial [Tetragenococcus koreensis]|nr:hypothetical protein [Tetragenococcus koreensis]